MSAFDHLADLIERAQKADRQPADRQQTREEREAERRQSREDIAFGRKSFLEQQARQAEESDPAAALLAHDKAMALQIIQAGARAKGLPVPTRLIQDADPGTGDDPSQGDDSPVDDRDHKTKKSKKKSKPKGDDDEDDAKEKDEDSDDFDSGNTDKPRGTAYPAPGESVSVLGQG